MQLVELVLAHLGSDRTAQWLSRAGCEEIGDVPDLRSRKKCHECHGFLIRDIRGVFAFAASISLRKQSAVDQAGRSKASLPEP